ncbi:mediator of RNA polymerase II transcription subunit 6 [Diutina catenulata]
MADAPLDEIQWKSPEFIQERGLHTGNVLEYFSLSPFYDRTSNNQILTMQFQFQQIQIPPGVSFHQYFQNRLAEMTGIEFIVAYTREPDFWIIRKQNRSDPKRADTLADYYVIGANIYQAPKVFDIISSRLLASVLSMKKTVELLHDMTNYHMGDGGHSYNNSAVRKPATTPASTALAPSKSATSYLATPLPGATPAGISTGVGTNPPSTNNGSMATSSAIEITAGAFDNLLGNVISSSNFGGASTTSNISFNGSSTSAVDLPSEGDATSIYLDDIPLYGKGSTVEMLGLKLNPDLESS